MINHRRRRTKLLQRLAVITAPLALTACITAVVTPEQEAKAGSAMSQQVAEQIGLYQDPVLASYLEAVGRRLVAALGTTPYQFQFAIVDQFEPNAFASPGGYIYVSRGLLAQMNNEEELAGVLAHEISHVTQRHHVRQAGRSLGTGLLTLPGRAVGVVSEDLGNMINSPIELAGQVYLSSYSRGQESEADQYGMRLAAKAGYNPLALADALAGIERSVHLLTGEEHQASYLDSHPTTPARVAAIEQLATELPPAPADVNTIANPQQLQAKLDGLWWGRQNPQQGIFRQDVFLNADMDFLVRFPSGWETVNTPRFVGAMEAEGNAYLALGTNSGEFTPEGYAAALITRMRDRSGLSPAISRSFNIQEWPAHLVRYDDSSDEGMISLFYVFLDTAEGSFTFMGMGFERFREPLREAVMSMRRLTATERNGIGGLRLRLAEIRPGETLQTWTERVGSQWSADLAAAMNGVDTGQPGAGETFKYVRRESYQPR
jgi:predicted Zn-dependent protease